MRWRPTPGRAIFPIWHERRSEMGTDNWLLLRLGFWIPLVLSLSVHEWAHAWSAWRLGDDTARRLGRLTLNPLAHLDPLGSVLLPLLGVPFGWAKPVPLNPTRFGRRVSLRTGLMITAAAGPISNLCLAVVCATTLGVLARHQPSLLLDVRGLRELLEMAVFLNVILATFNVLPIAPLDGSLIVDSVIPDGARPLWDRFQRLGPVALAAVILLPAMFGFSLFGWPLQVTQMWLDQLTGVAVR